MQKYAEFISSVSQLLTIIFSEENGFMLSFTSISEYFTFPSQYFYVTID